MFTAMELSLSKLQSSTSSVLSSLSASTSSS